MGYRFIDHTADVAADVEGASVGDLFVFAAQALTDTITNIKDVKAAVTQSVTLEAGSLEDLLVDWLNELLYRFEARDMLVSDAAVVLEERGGRCRLDGTIRGELFDPARHPSRVLVKSATYHGLHVTRAGDVWRARIVFDI